MHDHVDLAYVQKPGKEWVDVVNEVKTLEVPDYRFHPTAQHEISERRDKIKTKNACRDILWDIRFDKRDCPEGIQYIHDSCIFGYNLANICHIT